MAMRKIEDKMTYDEACRLIDPATDLDELDKIIYYNGFNGKKVAGEKLREASKMLVDIVRSVPQWTSVQNELPKCSVFDKRDELWRSEPVQTFTERGWQMVGYYWKDIGWTGIINRDFVYHDGFVTHWMPLLNGPEKGDEEK